MKSPGLFIYLFFKYFKYGGLATTGDMTDCASQLRPSSALLYLSTHLRSQVSSALSICLFILLQLTSLAHRVNGGEVVVHSCNNDNNNSVIVVVRCRWSSLLFIWDTVRVVDALRQHDAAVENHSWRFSDFEWNDVCCILYNIPSLFIHRKSTRKGVVLFLFIYRDTAH